MRVDKSFFVVVSILLLIIAYPTLVSALTGADIKNGTLTGADIKNGTVTGADIKNISLTGADIKNGTVTAVDIKNGSLAGIDIRNESLTGFDIKDGSIEGSDLGIIDFLTVNSINATDYVVMGSGLDIAIPSDGAGTPASYTLTWDDVQSSMGIDCQDSDGCSVTFSDASGAFVPGLVLHLYNPSPNTVTITDTPGVAELSGNFDMGQWDTLQLMYQGSTGGDGRFLELSRSDN